MRDAGGSIHCDSTPGVGTTFTLLLPERVVPARPPTPSPVRVLPTVTSAAILLVDDEAPVRRTIRRLLERDGYTILEASHAQEARELLARTSVALVILDQSMPNETGVHAFPSLRALTDAPVVLYSGMAPVAPAGIAAVLEKPARPDDLRQLVRSLLATRRERQPLESE